MSRSCQAAALLAFLLAGAACGTSAQTHASFDAWRRDVLSEAVARGVSPDVAEASLGAAEYLPKVVELDRKQPDGRISFEAYLKRVVPDDRIARGKRLMREHRALLDAVAQKYGVQKRFLVALWGVESDFGRNTGGFKVVDALATLAYDGRRGEFFKQELFRALDILEQGHIAPDRMRGSWAGAMGQTQFMPSSFVRLAVDEDGDGKRDIWSTQADVFASIANYLHKSGWDDGKTWGREVALAKAVPADLYGREVKKPLAEWAKLGVRRKDGSPLPHADLPASLVKPDPNGERVYLAYPNFDVLMTWNRSSYFGAGVGTLSDALRGDE
jgi:membrane-bound lytic murein transglycosylase B